MISPVLSYTSEIWGVYVQHDFKAWDNTPIEKTHLKFCKRYLEISNKASNVARRSELGRFPLIISGAPRAKRACGAPWVNKSTHPRKFGNHVTDRPTDRPSVRTTGIPMFTLTLSSYVGSPGESWLHINVVINWQLSKQGIRWPVSPDRIAGSGVDPSRSSILLKLSADNLFVFKWLQAHVHFF